ncbi:MAG: protein translocase subunit SecD, partial [Chitinophagales bacterium]
MQNVNATSVVKLIMVVVAVAVLAVLSVMGYIPIAKNLNLGMDLKGGLHVVLEAKERAGKKITSDTIQKSITVLRDRVDTLGVKEPTIQASGSRRVIIDLPGVGDPEEAANILKSTAQLEFRDMNGNIIVTGDHLKDATAELDQASNQPQVSLTFDKTGAKLFREGTRANVGKTIGIYLDGKLKSNPGVEEEIPNGQALIHGGFETLKEAEQTAALLRSGALPVTLDIIEKRTVGPLLGQDSLDKSINAGIIGLLMILIFMVGYYRLPGVVADISLVLYSFIVLGVMALLGSTLTLPGMAGFILSIGMAVDANIIIYERVKEEMRAGKTLQAAIEAGFNRAFWTIFDSNLTTLIAALVLMFFGTGPIKGFAVTLSIGIIASMLTAIVFTRFVLKL